jgi:hypothetical protein
MAYQKTPWPSNNRQWVVQPHNFALTKVVSHDSKYLPRLPGDKDVQTIR